ncbi:MAG: HDOD domain-containing protein [Candidatus Competibacteraceae bacterium]|nr:HDOD domain-containing protein [Candidatus Competibacteraceae bacterium]
MLSLEQEHCGITHIELGTQLINAWNLGSFMADAVFYHHEPASRIMDAHMLVKIVNLANLVVFEAEKSSGDEIFTAASQALNLNRRTVMDLMIEIRKTLSSIVETLELDIDEGTETTVTQHEKKLYLGEKLRDIILVNELNWQRKNDMVDVLENVYRNLVISLGVQNIVVFLYDRTSSSIYNASSVNNTFPSHVFNIPLKKQEVF